MIIFLLRLFFALFANFGIVTMARSALFYKYIFTVHTVSHCCHTLWLNLFICLEWGANSKSMCTVASDGWRQWQRQRIKKWWPWWRWWCVDDDDDEYNTINFDVSLTLIVSSLINFAKHSSLCGENNNNKKKYSH